MKSRRFAAITVFSLLSLGGEAAQVRSVSDGVYAASQAARGREIYASQCAECHGRGMEGTIGPPLVGDEFLANWSGRPLIDFIDKIQKTMPFEKPGTLSRQQSADLTAFVLEAGKFSAGQADLSEGAIAQIVFPPGRPRPAAAGPEGTLAELMRAIAFPNANVIFNLQLKNPAVQPKKPLASSPFDYVEWGSTVYPGWLAVDQAAVAIIETAPLLLTPGRRCQNGRPAPVDRADWREYVAALTDVGRVARKASQARNFDAFTGISEQLNDACAACHKVYRDKGGSEGSGAARCQ